MPEKLAKMLLVAVDITSVGVMGFLFAWQWQLNGLELGAIVALVFTLLFGAKMLYDVLELMADGR